MPHKSLDPDRKAQSHMSSMIESRVSAQPFLDFSRQPIRMNPCGKGMPGLNICSEAKEMTECGREYDIVDDESDFCEIVFRLLKRDGFAP